MELRFYDDPETGLPHIFGHGVTEEEVRQVLSRRPDTFRGRGKSWFAFGQTAVGRILKVVYVPDEGCRSAFVITAYELRGKALRAFRRRRRRRRR